MCLQLVVETTMRDSSTAENNRLGEIFQIEHLCVVGDDVDWNSANPSRVAMVIISVIIATFDPRVL